MRKLIYALAMLRYRLLTTIWSIVARMRLRLRGASVGRGLRVSGPLDLNIHPTARVSIGANCRIHSGFRGNSVGGDRRTGFWVSRGASLTIGDRVGMSNCTLMALNSITIEDEVFVGGDCNLYDNDFHSLEAAKRLDRPDRGVKSAPIVLRCRCFIGGHSLLLKGVIVGEEAVIGAGSVVTKSVPAGEIWAGNPARFVRKVAEPGSMTAGRN